MDQKENKQLGMQDRDQKSAEAEAAERIKSNDSLNSGKPDDKTYLEINLSYHLQKSIDDFVQGEKDNVSHLDLLWGELYGSINADFWGGVITEEQAHYLRGKYLFDIDAEEDE